MTEQQDSTATDIKKPRRTKVTKQVGTPLVEVKGEPNLPEGVNDAAQEPSKVLILNDVNSSNDVLNEPLADLMPSQEHDFTETLPELVESQDSKPKHGIHVKNNSSKSYYEPVSRSTIAPGCEILIECISALQKQHAHSNLTQMKALGAALEINDV